MPNFDLIATDLDGTLFYDREHIADRDRDALRRVRALGIPCAIATGRELDAVRPALDRLVLWDMFDYIIYSGGAGFFDIAKQEDVSAGMLSVETLRTIYERYRDCGLSVVLVQDGKLFVSEATPMLEAEAKLLHYPLVACGDLRRVMTHPHNKVILNGPAEVVDRVLPLAMADPDPAYEWHRSHDNYIDCYARNVNKGAALHALCARLGIDPARTLAIGDTENDLELLRAAGVSACPGDGSPAVQAVADYICCPAHEGAFADFCEQYLF